MGLSVACRICFKYLLDGVICDSMRMDRSETKDCY